MGASPACASPPAGAGCSSPGRWPTSGSTCAPAHRARARCARPRTSAGASRLAASPSSTAGAARRELELGLDPVHHRAQLLALALDLVVGLLLAHALEVLLAGPVLRDPLARELARLDLAEDVLHRLPRLSADH